ncbi:MAG: FlgO family outer membrane protein, partial [Acidobacteriota bacterium]
EQVVEDLAVQISDSLTAQEKKKVAILPFTDLAGQRNQLGQLLAEELINQLFIRSSGRFEVVERNRIDAIWAEQELGAEGWMTAEAIGGIGQLVGADAILTGSIAELNDRLRVNARLMSVPAGQLFATASTFMLKTGLEPLLDPIDDGSGGGGSGAPKARAQRVTVKNITFEVVGCEKQTRLITCRLVATNNDVDRDVRINTADYNPGTYLFDQQGRSFASQFVKIANQESGSYVTSRLITEVPTAIEVQFQGVPSTIEFVKILTIDTNLDTIEFRDIRF